MQALVIPMIARLDHDDGACPGVSAVDSGVSELAGRGGRMSESPNWRVVAADLPGLHNGGRAQPSEAGGAAFMELGFRIVC